MESNPPGNSSDFASLSPELEAIYSSAPIGLCVLDTQLRYVRINQVLADLNGFTIAEHLGRTVRELLPAIADAFEPLLREVLKTGEARLNVEVSGETAAQPGIVRTWNEHWLPIKNEAGEVIGINIVAEEVTERKQIEERYRIFNQASEVLSSSLDYALTLTRVTQLAVPVMADWCVVDITDEEGALHRLAITHADANKQNAAEALKQHFPVIKPDTRHTLMRVLETGKTWFDPAITEERFVSEARDADHLRLLRELGFKSEIVVPLAARGKLLGGLTFVYGHSNRRHTAADVELVEVLARRAALAIDNARLYRDARLARQEAEQAAMRIYLLQEITSALSQVRNLPGMVDILLNRAVPRLGAHLGAVLTLSEDGTALKLAGQTGLSPDGLEGYAQFPLNDRYPVTDAARTELPVWIESEAEYTAQYPHLIEAFRTLSRTQALAALPLFIKGEIGGVILFGFPQAHSFDHKERALFSAIADQCAQAIDRIGLSEKERELAVVQERQRLARELHDAVSQTLTGATVLAESAERIWKKDPARAFDIINQVIKLNHAAQAELRTLLWELRPEAILKSRQSDLLRQLVQIVNGRKGLRAELRFEGEDDVPLPESVHIALYRIAQESLNNVVKHSRATRVLVEFTQAEGIIRLRIVDDGRGFDTNQVFAGLGLGTMRERATSIHAALTITSQPSGGTKIELSWTNKAPAV